MSLALSEFPSLTQAELDQRRAFVETIVGRPLREAEAAIDVLGLDSALNRAKAELQRAIEAEKRRALRAYMRGRPLRLQLTKPMILALERLFRLGRREALVEFERLGLAGRSLATPEDTAFERLRPHLTAIEGNLVAFSIRLEDAAVEAEFNGTARSAIARALVRKLGARSIAAEVVSGALTSGLAATFEEQEAAGRGPPGWEYTAVLDSGTCDPCEALDGSVYESWAAIQIVLPDGGPNPSCAGSGRCRCRPVPLPA